MPVLPSTLRHRPAITFLLAASLLALGGCDSQSDRDAKLEARIAAAEAKAAAAEKRANAAEAAAAHSSPVTVDPGPDDPDASQNDNPDDQPPLEGDFSQQDSGNQPSLDLQPDNSPQRTVVQSPPPTTMVGPIPVGHPPPVS